MGATQGYAGWGGGTETTAMTDVNHTAALPGVRERNLVYIFAAPIVGRPSICRQIYLHGKASNFVNP